jgi:hypothetical protein
MKSFFNLQFCSLTGFAHQRALKAVLKMTRKFLLRTSTLLALSLPTTARK